MTSPYLRAADTLRDQGYHPMPAMPGAKVPGAWSEARGWQPMGQWSSWCDTQPPEFLHSKWQDWPDAGVCIAHGPVVGLDIDTDRTDVAHAAVEAVGPSPVRRRGSKGWMGYYRPGKAAEGHTARVRWYEGDKIAVEMLLHGTQSILPPTIHPGTGQPYTWLTPDSMEDVSADELPELPDDAIARLDAAFGKLGLTRQAPRRVHAPDYERPAPSAHDLEKPAGRSMNDRAMESDAIDQWWPALDMPKSRYRGRSGMWEAVPFWRVSNGGRPVSDRNPNLKATPGGIVDFGADRSYTPVDVVMAARDCSFPAAMDWLGGFVRSESGVDFSGLTAPAAAENSPDHALEGGGRSFAPDVEIGHENKGGEGGRFDPHRWAATPIFSGRRSHVAVKPIALPSDAEWGALMPKTAPPFPVQDFSVAEGLLGEVAAHIDAASSTWTEAGALAVTLPLLGSVMGRAYATPSNLRTNIYTAALGGSGTGKTSLVAPAKEILTEAGLGDLIGGDRFASGSGVLQMLIQNPRRVSFLDEFGHMLQQIGSPGAGVHAKAILTEFTALYSAAGTVFSGTAYADGRDNSVTCPHLCLFGMATPDQFWRAFGSASLEDGSIARYLVFPLGQTAAKVGDDSAAAETAKAVNDLQRVILSLTPGNLGQHGTPPPMKVPLDEHAERARAALKEKEMAFAEYAEQNAVRGGPAILRRVTENALKIALISAVGRNPSSPSIDGRDMDIGHAIAWWSANVMISSIASHIADNQIERDVNDVERFIMEAGERGRDWRDIQRRFRRIRSRDLKEIVEALEKEGGIRLETRTPVNGGHVTKRYFPKR